MVPQMDELNKVVLETERLILSSLTLADCSENYLSWLNDTDVNMYLESGFYQHNMQGLVDFVNGYQSNKKAVFLVIRLKENNKHIGNIKIDKINYIHRNCEYGIMMGDKTEWGKGYAKEASIAIINYTFEVLGLNKVNLGVIDSNIVAVSIYEKMGFIVEGILKQNFFERSSCTLKNEIRMAVFRNTWQHGKK
jgi:ribosomal-protein-alanine N-acetyltransferase